MTSNRRMRNMVKHTGLKYDVPVCDLATSLAEIATDGIPGNELFLDHCHPNADGHKQLGIALAQCIVDHDLLGMGAIGLRTTPPPKNLFRVDHYRGHRPIPGVTGLRNTYPTGSPEHAATAGHMAFVADRFDQALQHYDQALTLGAPSGPIQHSIGLTHLHRGDLQAARTALHDAQEAGDAEAEKVLETLSP